MEYAEIEHQTTTRTTRGAFRLRPSFVLPLAYHTISLVGPYL